MAKFVGIIGYLQTVEKEPGSFEPTIIEKPCKGDLIKNVVKRMENQESTNDNININNIISIVADPYTKEHVYEMKYLKFKHPKMGGFWKIATIDIDEPRIKITLGGLYNGIKANTSN